MARARVFKMAPRTTVTTATTTTKLVDVDAVFVLFLPPFVLATLNVVVVSIVVVAVAVSWFTVPLT